MVAIHLSRANVVNVQKSREAAEMLQRNINDQVQWLAKKKASSLPSRPPGVLLSINVNLRDDSHEAPRINRKVNESYELKISYQADEKRIQVGSKALHSAHPLANPGVLTGGHQFRMLLRSQTWFGDPVPAN